MRTFKRIANRGFTLVELMIVVAIIGVLAALAIYGVRKYLLNAKTAEAKEGIGRMAKDAASAYEAEAMSSGVLTLGTSTGITHHLCTTAAAMIPAAKAEVQGKKYQSNISEWGSAGWECLKFTMRDPQYFQYNYNSTGTAGAENDVYTSSAYGDLNGDAVMSTFYLSGKIQKGGTGGLVVTVAPNYEATNPEE